MSTLSVRLHQACVNIKKSVRNVPTVVTWNFGLCATRSREPRQARKGATVSGLPRVPQITRSSSHRMRRGELWRCMMILAGAIGLTFLLGCGALVVFVLWLSKQNGRSKQPDAK